LAVWLVAVFEALSCQVTTTFDTSCAARKRTAPAINNTACWHTNLYVYRILLLANRPIPDMDPASISLDAQNLPVHRLAIAKWFSARLDDLSIGFCLDEHV
jgi:hypothetical protein